LKTKARLAIFIWIEIYAIPRRRHAGLGQMSPINFEVKATEKPVQDAEITPTIFIQIPSQKRIEIKKSNASVQTGQVHTSANMTSTVPSSSVKVLISLVFLPNIV
jgi:hypothetical protein